MTRAEARTRPARPPAGPRRTRVAQLADRVPGLLASYLAFVASFCALTAVLPFLRGPLHWLREIIEVVSFGAPPNLATAAFLGILAAAVRRRMRGAWWFVVGYLVLGRVLSWLTVLVSTDSPRPVEVTVGGGLDVWLRTVFGLLALTLMVLARDRFTARTQPGSRWRALQLYLGVLVVGVGVGFGLLTLFPGTLAAASDRLQWAVLFVLGGLGSPVVTGVEGVGPRPVTFLCGLLGAVAVLASAYLLFRPRTELRRLEPDDEQRIRALLARYGDEDSLGYFATRRDKAAVFSGTGKSAVTFRVVSAVSLASGDPLGDVEAWPGAIRVWLQQARSYGWIPAVMGAGEAAAKAYAAAGLSAIELGDEAIIDARAFSLEGRSMRVVRQAVGRVERAGYTVRVRRHADLSAQDMADVIARAGRWRDTETERGFSMALSRLGDPADGDCVLVEGIDPEGELRALLSFVPWGTQGLSLDLMRRDRACGNGVTEFMVVSLIERARSIGVDRLSLNFAMFRAAFEHGERIGAGPVLRLWRGLLVLVSRWWQLESLYRANAKFQPEWQPRYLCYAAARDLPRIGFASAVAEGFITSPSMGKLHERGAQAAASRAGVTRAASAPVAVGTAGADVVQSPPVSSMAAATPA